MMSSVPHSQWRPSWGCSGIRCGLSPPAAALRTVRGLVRQEASGSPWGGPDWGHCSNPVTPQPGLPGSPLPPLRPTELHVALCHSTAAPHDRPVRETRRAAAPASPQPS